jgi:hypothetical protein
MKDDDDRFIEIVLLLVHGIFSFVFGLLLFGIHTGRFPYNPNSAFGLFLVIVSFQVVTMGKTPFGDFRRSWGLVAAGLATAAFGISACFLPGHYVPGLTRDLTGLILTAGGITLLLQLFFSADKAKLWIEVGSRILRHLTIACAAVYVLKVILGLVLLMPGIATDEQTVTLLLADGASFFYLVWSLRKVREMYPGEPVQPPPGPGRTSGLFGEASLPLLPAILILLGMMQVMLGLFLFPVGVGLLAYSPDGQLGLMLIVMAIQMMALGDTPLGSYRRSVGMVILGIPFAALGVVSCVAPGLLTEFVRVLLALLNIAGGATSLVKQYRSRHPQAGAPANSSDSAPPAAGNVTVLHTAVNILTLVFGACALVPGAVSWVFVALLLVANGLLLLLLAFALHRLIAFLAHNSASQV